MTEALVMQAGCVSIGGRGILIAGAAGSGKSSLALALIDRGASLVGDDGVILEVRDTASPAALWAAPHPHTQGLLEVRNLGILRMPFVPAVRVCLMLQLDPAAPRYIEEAGREDIDGVAIPVLRLWPGSLVLALRAELALCHYALE